MAEDAHVNGPTARATPERTVRGDLRARGGSISLTPSEPEPGDRRPRRDRTLLIAARGVRGFGAGALSIVVALDLSAAGYASWQIGIVLGLALGGAAAWAVAVPRLELHWPRRTVFVISAGALGTGGLLFWADLADPWVLLIAVGLGGIVAGGADVSPLAALEQAALAGTTADRGRTRTYALYNLVGYVGVALGALAAAPLTQAGAGPATALTAGPHDVVLLLYGLLGLALLPTYARLSPSIDRRVPSERPSPLSPPSRPTVFSLAALFSVDSFAGGLIVNSLVVLYFSTRYHPAIGALSLVFFVSNLAAGISLVAAAPLARRFGLVNTMVFTHLPSNVFLILVVFAPSFAIASGLWIARAALSQMDVPTRQSYTQSVVPPEDRAAAAGYTTAARSVQAVGAPISGALISAGGPWIAAPLALAGGVKIAYDVAVFARFRRLTPPEERLVEPSPTARPPPSRPT